MNSSQEKISVIIPVLNEENSIVEILRHLKNNTASKNNIKEILVIDGGSTDQTMVLAQNYGALVYKTSKGRAQQLNFGAEKAKGDILYFLHADTYPPKNFDQHIKKAVQNNYNAGCFRMKFNSNKIFLQFFAWFSRLNLSICRGGDQSLFITKKTFVKLNGFNESYKIYEDNELTSRIYKSKTYFIVLPQYVITSARRYSQKGIYKLQYHFGVIHTKKILGATPEKLYSYYKKNIAI